MARRGGRSLAASRATAARATHPGLRCVAAAAALVAAAAEVNVATWVNSAFAPDSAATRTSAPSVDFGAGWSADAVFSVRVTGTVASPIADLMTFDLATDGLVRLWINDTLVIDDPIKQKPRIAAAFLNFSMAAGVTYSLRLEYAHYGAPTPPTLALSWRGNFTAHAVVPPSAFTPYEPAWAVPRQAMRDRLYGAPRVAWQTAFNPTMGCHVHVPSGVGLYLTLGDAASLKSLGDIIVFRRSNPAVTTVGLHSYNGSDYTDLRVEAWLGHACTVRLQTAVVNNGADLIVIGDANGTDCGKLLLLAYPVFLWDHAGAASTTAPGVMTAVAPGFPNVTFYSASGPGGSFPGFGDTYLAIKLADGGRYGVSSGAPYGLPAMAAAVAAGAAVMGEQSAKWGDLATAYEAMQSVIAWNTMYTPYEGVITPVSRGWDFGCNYVLFDWDNLFLGYMATLEGGIPKDVGYSNVIQILLARTATGMVPNYAACNAKSEDRSEPQIGAYVVRELYRKWREPWLVEAVFDTLLGWNNWVWTHRRGEGSLAPPGDAAYLMVLGSDPTSPRGDGSTNTMQGARYESGLDNSPMYDQPPVGYDNMTHHMQLYDVGMTAQFLSDTAALLELAAAIGRADVAPLLQERYNLVAGALNTYMWDADAATYTNVLFNGSFYPRYGPTSFMPLMSGAAPDDRAAAAMALLASPLGFCVSEYYGPAGGAPESTMMTQFYDGHDNAACVSDACNRDVVVAAYNFIRIEAVVLSTSANGTGLLPLNLFYSVAAADYATTASASPPAAGYVFVRQEGWCYPSAAGAPNLVNLSLWYDVGRKDYQTCGSAACVGNALQAGYSLVQGDMCWAANGTGPVNWPCRYGGPSIARADPAFLDNNYWRGRIWGPHLMLMYWGLAQYDHVPEVRAARLVMVDQGLRLVEQEWVLFRHVNENYNGLTGLGSDVGNADPFYHWGALAGFMAFVERGLY